VVTQTATGRGQGCAAVRPNDCDCAQVGTELSVYPICQRSGCRAPAERVGKVVLLAEGGGQ